MTTHRTGPAVRRPGLRPAAPRRGAAAMEFALVVPVFFLIVFGLVEVGRALMVRHLLTNAARQGCRTAIIGGRANSDVTAAVTAALNGQGVSGYTTAVAVNGKTADASTATTNDEITVSVSVPVGSVSWLPGLRYLTGSLNGTYTLRRE